MGGRDGFLGAGFKAGLRFQLRVSSPPTTKPLGHTFLLDLLGVIQGFRSRQEAPVVWATSWSAACESSAAAAPTQRGLQTGSKLWCTR